MDKIDLKALESQYEKNITNRLHIDNERYKKYCDKFNKKVNLKNYKIIKNHTLDEYLKKYGKKFNKRKIVAFKKDELWVMKKNKKYWEIPNNSNLLYFEVPSNKKVVLIPLLVVAALAGAGAGLYFGGVINLLFNNSGEGGEESGTVLTPQQAAGWIDEHHSLAKTLNKMEVVWDFSDTAELHWYQGTSTIDNDMFKPALHIDPANDMLHKDPKGSNYIYGSGPRKSNPSKIFSTSNGYDFTDESLFPNFHYQFDRTTFLADFPDANNMTIKLAEDEQSISIRTDVAGSGGGNAYGIVTINDTCCVKSYEINSTTYQTYNPYLIVGTLSVTFTYAE